MENANTKIYLRALKSHFELFFGVNLSFSTSQKIESKILLFIFQIEIRTKILNSNKATSKPPFLLHNISPSKTPS